MRTARRLSAFVRTNALLANLCDTKKGVCDNGTRMPIAADCISLPIVPSHIIPNVL